MMHSYGIILAKRSTLLGVLILVLMDDALVLQNLGYALFKRIVRLVCAS